MKTNVGSIDRGLRIAAGFVTVFVLRHLLGG